MTGLSAGMAIILRGVKAGKRASIVANKNINQ